MIGVGIGIWSQRKGGPRAPSGFVLLVDNNGDYLVDDEGAYLIAPEE